MPGRRRSIHRFRGTEHPSSPRPSPTRRIPAGRGSRGLPLTAVADTIVLPVVVVYVDRNRFAGTPFTPIATSVRDDRYAGGSDFGGIMSPSPDKRGRISRWRSRMQWRRLLGRVRSGRIRRRPSSAVIGRECATRRERRPTEISRSDPVRQSVQTRRWSGRAESFAH